MPKVIIFPPMEISPIEQISDGSLDKVGIKLACKRDDLIGGPAQGNKHRKLRGWIELAEQHRRDTLVSFGGAFSNHLYALAWMAQAKGLKAIGYVRGERDPKNPTLRDCQAWGMELIFLSRSEYQNKKHQLLLDEHPHAIVIPEGGLGIPGQEGMIKLGHEILEQGDFTHWACAAGTGTTALGLRSALADHGSSPKLLVFDVLKRNPPSSLVHPSIEVIASAFGGFAKTTPELLTFMRKYHAEHGIYLDPIYTGKMMLKLKLLIESGYFPKGSNILAIHTGGLQGIRAYNYRFGKDLPCPPLLEPVEGLDVKNNTS